MVGRLKLGTSYARYFEVIACHKAEEHATGVTINWEKFTDTNS